MVNRSTSTSPERWTKIPANKQYFDVLNLPYAYDIDKELLKTNYYLASKLAHPDRRSSTGTESALLNKAFSVLRDDFLRAKLFSVPSEVSGEFLEECLVLEERIRKGESLEKYLKERIEDCKKRYFDPKYLGRWGYYERLLEMARQVDR